MFLKAGTVVLGALLMAACAGSAPNNSTSSTSPASYATATGPPAPLASRPTSAALESESKAWAQCAIKKIKELDDGRTEVRVVAGAVQVGCMELSRPGIEDADQKVIAGAILKTRVVETKRKAWVACTGSILRDDGVSSPVAVATPIARACSEHWPYETGGDVELLVSVINKNRARDPLSKAPVRSAPVRAPAQDFKF